MQRFPAIDPDATAAPATAEQLAEAYTADPAAANARFANRLLEVTGTITQADPKACTLQLEVPTDATLQVRLQFEPADFVAVPSGERRLTFKAVCRGAVRGQKLLTLTECRYYDADAADATAQRLTAEYFPIQAGRQWDVIRVTYSEPPPPPRAARPRPAYTVTPDAPPVAAKAKPSPAQRLQYRLKPEGLLLVGQLQLGTFAGASLFDGAAPPVKWVGKPVKPDVAPAKCVEAFRLRASPLMVEQGFAKPPADPDAPVTPPDPKDQGMTWHPVIPLNARAGRSRVANLAPGVVLTTTVESFFRDAEGREAVKVVSVLTDERSKDVRQETVVTYAKNVGEVSRVVTLRDATRSRVLSEQRLDGEPSETTLTGAAAPKK